MSLLKLARDPFKIETGVWLDFDKENGVKLLPVFNPVLAKVYLETLDTEGVDNLDLGAVAAIDAEKSERIAKKILTAAIVDWKGMSLTGERAENIEEVLSNLLEKRFEHLAARAVTHIVVEDYYRPDVELTKEDVVKN